MTNKLWYGDRSWKLKFRTLYMKKKILHGKKFRYIKNFPSRILNSVINEAFCHYSQSWASACLLFLDQEQFTPSGSTGSSLGTVAGVPVGHLCSAAGTRGRTVRGIDSAVNVTVGGKRGPKRP